MLLHLDHHLQDSYYYAKYHEKKKPQQQHKNICIFYWILSAIYKGKLIT